MLSNLVTEVLQHDRIQTTQAKAREVRPLVEKMVTLGKNGTLHARRQALKVVKDRTVVKKLFDELGPLYAERPGGYTRIIKLGNRLGDNALVSILELVDREQTPVEKKEAKAKKETPVEAPEAVAAEPEEAPEPVTDEDESAAEAAAEPKEKETEEAAPELEEKASAEPEPAVAEDGGPEKLAEPEKTAEPEEKKSEES
jgi:large subunit ribosomal protein L17